MAWMEDGLQISLKRFALSMGNEMAAGDLGRATNCGLDGVTSWLDFEDKVSIV